jgi:glycosyltransferase involved in cell wall biosynthesis
MKIIINAMSARLGGGQTYVRNLLSHLPAQTDLDILVFAPDTLKLPMDSRIRLGSTNWPTKNPILRALWEYIELPRILATEKAHILFCPGGLITSPVPKGCQTVTTFQNMMPFDLDALARVPLGLQKIRNIIIKQLMLHSMKNASLTIFISNYASDIIKSLIRVRKSVIIPHGISRAFRTRGENIQRPLWLPKSEYLLYVSRFEVYKHHFEVAAAFAELPINLLKRYKLLLVGEVDEVLAARIVDLAQKKGLEESIKIVGPIAYSDLPAVYHHASVNLFASSCENCPNILLEALGAGRPVLSSNVMPMPEFGGDAVSYFSPTDPKSICDALILVLQDEARSNELATAAALRSADFDLVSSSLKTWHHITSLVTHGDPELN